MLARYYKKNTMEAGCDEAGRGCLAGPVVAAAVILPAGYENILLNDSKKLSANAREKLQPEIEREALAWAVAFVDNTKIDEINILNASFLAMHKAIEQLNTKPELLLIDGNRFNPYPDIDHECFIKGDAKYMSIAAASILAKTHRDAYMKKIDGDFPGYGWSQNMGYPTEAHRTGIMRLGATIYHRKTFRLLPEQLEIF